MKLKVLRMLIEAEGYLSGQRICEALGVSRTAVWKAVNELKEEGYVIESVSNKGYRLLEEPKDFLSREALECHMQTSELGRRVYFYDKIDSTNLEAKRLAEAGAVNGAVVFAREQSAGKGRRGKSWSSPPDCNVYMSLLLRPRIEPEHASCLTLVAALGVCRGIRELTGLEAQIKWPNDIVVKEHKVCGILTEMNLEADYIRYVLVGIGVNVNVWEFPKELREIAGSLCLAAGRSVDRRELAAEILLWLEHYYEIFLRTEDLSGLLEEYQRSLVNVNRTVRLLKGDRELLGVAQGIAEDGGLLVQTGHGVEKVVSGEVSVRGLYGYV